ncbi:MAG: PP2C family serine/threonine-protein phosphatase [Anaerolineae bacterium]
MTLSEFIRASVEHPERCEDAIMTFANGDGKAPVFAIIDGMGGHQRKVNGDKWITGRDAALSVRETLIEDLLRLPADIDASANGEAERRAVAALQRAHQQITVELNSSNGGDLPLHERVGAVATVVIVCENGSRLLVAQVGDTRAYLFSEGELIQLCYDEDNIQYLVERGVLSEEDGARISEILNEYDGVNEPTAEGSVTINGTPYELYLAWRWFLVGNSALNIPPSNVVIHALGVESTQPTPQVSRIEIAAGEKLILCSDGVYKNLSDAELIEFLSRDDLPADAMAQRIGEAAYARSTGTDNRRSTKDDVSAVVVVW